MIIQEIYTGLIQMANLQNILYHSNIIRTTPHMILSLLSSLQKMDMFIIRMAAVFTEYLPLHRKMAGKNI